MLHRRPSRVLITEVAMCKWLGAACPGDILQYHHGVLALDTTPDGSRLSAEDRAELCRVARRAMWAWEKGLAHLVQRRHGPDNYSYLLIARRRAGSPAAAHEAAAGPAEAEGVS